MLRHFGGKQWVARNVLHRFLRKSGGPERASELMQRECQETLVPAMAFNVGVTV
jgi:hypothetical protein